ncbi:hypothetical protein O181_010206 [Austropuccinia psidii MF-1]|uniref:Uncharacterized protein n=1 Tax=Austropuccinia psidii MF-1 TaxID=1389203 RepID=A0A9Q3BQL2_9BASI|nr:hypothetical protein [Austropuccinia psidii MF-1]
MSVWLERTHVVALECQFLKSEDTCGERMMGHFGEFPVSEAPTPYGTSGYSSFTGYRRQDVERWTNTGGPIIVSGRPIYSGSNVPIPRINEQGVVKWIRRIADSPTGPNAEGSDELDGEEVQIISQSINAQYSKKFATSVPPPSSGHFTARPPKASAMRRYSIRPSPTTHYGPSQVHPPQQLQPVSSTNITREVSSPLPFPSTQVFQRRERWPIRVSRGDQNDGNDGQNVKN